MQNNESAQNTEGAEVQNWETYSVCLRTRKRHTERIFTDRTQKYEDSYVGDTETYCGLSNTEHRKLQYALRQDTQTPQLSSRVEHSSSPPQLN